MITIECDDCERTFDVEDEQAGGKVACPYCGDMNRVPEAHGPQAKGLPPDEGPEQDISVVHPAMFRAHPFRFLAITVLFVGGIALAIYSATSDQVGVWLAWVGLVITLAGAGWWVVWYVTAHLWVKLTISNKRTIRHEGIIRRHTSEVLHDHVRNVAIKQSFLQRLLNVGYIGISSSGQDGIEIEVRDIPRPYAVKALIDEYREM